MTDWSIDWRVTVDGRDMTSAMRPYLIGVSVTDKAGTVSDSASLTLDDTAGQLLLPAPGSLLTVRLAGVMVFEGYTEVPRSRGSRSGGRLMTVSAKGFDTAGKAKEPLGFHRDETSLADFLAAAAGMAGLTLSVDPALGAITRDYWSAENESFLQIGRRLASELSGTFKIRGTKAVLARRGQGLTPGGKALPTINAAFSDNLISWDIAPKTPRRQFGGARVRYFDRETGRPMTKEVEFGTGGEAVNVIRTMAADAGHAETIAEARKRQSAREGGEGRVTLDIAPEAQAEGALVLTGARPGIDGTYRIASVEHSASRDAGSITTLEIKQPAGGAGTDARVV